MGNVVTEGHAIIRAQYLDLVYSQSRTLYDLITHAPRPSTDSAKPPIELLVDRVVGSIQPSYVAKLVKKQKTSTATNSTSSTPTVSTKVNVIQSS